MKGRRPCIHGDLCRGIYKLTGRIYSVRCPYGCKFYEPVKAIKKGGTEWLNLQRKDLSITKKILMQ